MLGQFHLDGGIWQLVADSDDVGSGLDYTGVEGLLLKIICNITLDQPIPVEGGLTYVAPRTVKVLADGTFREVFPDGSVATTSGIDLLAAIDDLFQDPVQWTVVAVSDSIKVGGVRFKPRAWTFNAPEDGWSGTLEELMPAASVNGVLLTRGERGPVTRWRVVDDGPPRLWQQYVADTGEVVGDPVNFLVDFQAGVEDIVGNYEPETVNLLNRMTIRPDFDRRYAINALIRDLKEYDLWDRLDGFYIFAAHSQQAALLNWRRDTADMAAVNAPDFTVDVGFTGDGAAAYLTNSSAEVVHASLTDLAVGLWLTTKSTVGWDLWWTGDWHVGLTDGSNSIGWHIGNTVGPSTPLPPNSQLGIYVITRVAPDEAYLYKEGAPIDEDTAMYIDPGPIDNTLPFRLLTTSGAESWSDATISFASYGAGMNDAEVSLFYRALFDYMDAIGVA
jgi:hypothetical protein